MQQRTTRRSRRIGVVAATIGLVVAVVATTSPAGAAPAGTAAVAGPPPPVVEPFALAPQSPNTAWARQILERYLAPDAEPGAASVQQLARLLDSTQQPAATSVGTALHASGPVRHRVGELFEQLLDRPADPGGLDYWSRQVQAIRATYEQLVVSLTISSEAYRSAGSTPAGYTDWVYEHVLQRPADPSGRAYWIRRLEEGTSRDRFVRSFLRSAERARAVVDGAFQRDLWRPADPGGLAYWVGRYTAATVNEIQLDALLLGSDESRNAGCGYDPTYCLLPFPSNRYATRNADTPTGWQIAFKGEWAPRTASGVVADPSEWNRNDGFSVGQAAVTRVPGLDLDQTGAAPLTDIGASLAADAPIVLLDATTGQRHPYFAELDANVADGAPEQMLYVRPAVNYEAGHTYVVALRDLRDGAGDPIPTDPDFAAERDRVAALEDAADARSDYDVDLAYGLAVLDEEGVDPFAESIHSAWTFTVASTESTAGRLLHVRDDALGALGGGAPDFTVDEVIEDPRAGVARRVVGTFEAPLYLTGDGAPGQEFTVGTDGLPDRNGTYTASFDCELPELGEGEQARLVMYGHGLFGSNREVRSGSQAAMVGDHQMAYCATDWIGMSEGDLGNALTILQDVSTFNTLADRSQQGILNFVVLGRLMQAADGLVSDAAFQDGTGDPLLDTGALFYDGNSQGGIIGGALVAVDPSVQAGVLGVPGMNYSTLLERSVDFDPFFDVMKTTYPDAGDRVIGLQLIQMLWDRAEANGYAAHLNATDNLPGTPPKRVLLHVALGDHQVAPLTAEIEARTAGMAVHRPMYLSGRTSDVAPGWDLPTLTYPSSGSALIVWDSGADLAPLGNVPPRTGDDPHGDPRSDPDAQQQKSDFLQTGGTITDQCGAAPCEAAG